MNNLDIRSPVLHTFLFFSLLLWLLLFVFAKMSLVVSLAIALIVTFLAVFVLMRLAAGLVLRSFKCSLANERQFPRLHNAIEGICVNHGLDKPDLYVLENSKGNAVAVADKRSQAIVITTGAVDGLDLIEIEGLLALLIAKCIDNRLPKKTAEAFFLRFPLWSIFVKVKKYKTGVLDEDFRGTQLTRYPPGVQRALLRLSELGTKMENSPKTTSHLWLMDPKGIEGEGTHPSTEERVLALEGM